MSIYWFVIDNGASQTTFSHTCTLIFSRLSICSIHLVAWLYAACTATIVIFYQRVNQKLRHLSTSDGFLSVDRLLATAQQLRRLHQSSELIHARFGLVLFVNYVSLVICVTQAIYYTIRYAQLTNLSLLMDVFNLMELVGRFFLMCHTADSLKNCVSCPKNWKHLNSSNYKILHFQEIRERRRSPPMQSP